MAAPDGEGGAVGTSLPSIDAGAAPVARTGGGIPSAIAAATIDGTGWDGSGGSSWEDDGNWDNTARTPDNDDGNDERNLFFGQGWHNAGRAGSTTANNDIVGYAGWRITFEDINANGVTDDAAFTITGNGFSLFDFGVGNFPRIQNNSFVTQTVSLSGTLTLQNNQGTGADNNSAQINPLNGDLVFNNAIDLAGVTQLFIFGNTGRSVTFNGAITSTGNSNLNSIAISTNTDGRMPTMIVTGTGSTYGGGTFVNAGTLQLGLTSGSFTNGAVSGTITLGDNNSGGGNAPLAQLLIGGSGGQTFTNPIVVRAGSSGLKKVTTAYTGTNTWSGGVTLQVPVTFDTGSGSTLEMSGAIAGNAAGTTTLTKTGAGTLILSNSGNTYTGTSSGTLNASGTQIAAGTLGITSDTSLGLAPAGPYNNIQFTGSATLQDTANNVTLHVNRNIGLANGITATFDSNGNTFTINGVINDGANTGNLNKVGAGTLYLNNQANSYSGITTISAGVLQVDKLLSGGSNSSIGNSAGAAANLVIDGGTLRYTGAGDTTGRGFTIGQNGATIESSGTGALNFSATAAGSIAASGTGNRTLTLGGTNTGANVLSAGIVDPTSGTTSLRKDGAGSWTVGAAQSTYTGSTIINAGTLAVDNGGVSTARLSNTSDVTVNSGGTLLLAQSTVSASSNRINNAAAMTLNGGTFNTNGRSEASSITATSAQPGLGALTLSSSSIIDLGSGASILAFANSSAAMWSGTLSIYNWSGNIGSGDGTDRVYFGNTSSGLTGTQLNMIQFFSGAGSGALGSAMILADGEIVPVPEPSTWIAAFLSAGVIGWSQRNRIQRLVRS